MKGSIRRGQTVSHCLRLVVLRDGQCVRSHIDFSDLSRSCSIADLSEVYNAPFFFKITCISMVINIDIKGMFIEGNLARESVLYVVVTADLNQTICYLITTTFGDVLCLYQSFNLLRQSSVRRYSAFEENFLWFHLPQSAVLNAFSVLSIPTGDTQNTRDLGTGVPKTRGYPNQTSEERGLVEK